MIVIAENLNTRNRDYMSALKKRDGKKISSLVKKLADFRPDIINIQCSLDGAGLDFALLDVHDINIRRSIYLIRSFRDEVVFAPTDIA